MRPFGYFFLGVWYCTFVPGVGFCLFLLEAAGRTFLGVPGRFAFPFFLTGLLFRLLPGLGLIGSFSLPSLQKLVVGALYPSAHDYPSCAA